ncbi:MAG TPA: NUDIX domain-containing protein [Streptosporangiaceae bacterium]
MITRTCLCLITRMSARVGGGGLEPGDGRREVLLGFKKSGFGAGRWVGLGGHIEDGEEPAEAAAREVAEESGLNVTASALTHVACLRFIFPTRPSWDQTADVFITADFAGEPAESDEVVPRWFASDAMPFDGMWDDARYWMPLVLAGRRVTADITFAEDCATVAATDPELAAPPVEATG